MELSYRHLRFRLSQAGLLPSSRIARAAWYALGLDVLLFAIEKTLGWWFKVSAGQNLSGWVTFLSSVVITLFALLLYRWLKVKMLWRLRNRLIVTYVFIGVIPALLLIAMAGGTLYLFSGQFANFVVTSELNSQLRSMQAANAAIANELAARLEAGQPAGAASLEGLRRRDPNWSHYQVCAWLDSTALPLCGNPPQFPLPVSLTSDFRAIVRDRGNLHLRAAIILPVRGKKLVVISSEPLDKEMTDKIAADLGQITLYATGVDLLNGGGQPGGVSNSSKPLIVVDGDKGSD
jgi:sigma-B regulation protein RsbU (phosphoserine phosphatase)